MLHPSTSCPGPAVPRGSLGVSGSRGGVAVPPHTGCRHSSGRRGARSLALIISQPPTQAATALFIFPHQEVGAGRGWGLQWLGCRRLSLPGPATAGTIRWQRGFTWGWAGIWTGPPGPSLCSTSLWKAPGCGFSLLFGMELPAFLQKFGREKIRYDKTPSFRDAKVL